MNHDARQLQASLLGIDAPMIRKDRVIRAPAATDIVAIEPLIPRSSQLGPLVELSQALNERSRKLTGAAPGLRRSLTQLVRTMNAFYSYKIEGVNISPKAIERAFYNRFPTDLHEARAVKMALEHMHLELWNMVIHSLQDDWRQLFDGELLRNLHDTLFEGCLTEAGHSVFNKGFRDINVKVGIHIPPTTESVPKFIHRWSEFYSKLPSDPSALIGIACAHHRLAWIHPFEDGNGRVTRLHTQLVLDALGLTQGIWSPTRGLAHRQEEYFARLEDADEHRRGDYDGRGALSEQGLVRFVQFFLEVCLEQVDFMAEMLDQSKFNNRLEAWLCHEAAIQGSVIRREALTPMAHIAEHGPITLTKFKAMTGLSEEPAEALLQALINQDVLCIEGLKWEVTIDFPFNKLSFVLPGLWPEAERDYLKS